MKSILILIISLTMIFPATIFANNRSVASKMSIADMKKQLNVFEAKLEKEGWRSSTKVISKAKSERKMTNESKGLATKSIFIKSRKKMVIKLAVFKSRSDGMAEIFNFRNQVGYKRITVDLAGMETKNGATKVRQQLDKAMASLEAEIVVNLNDRRSANSSVISKMIGLLIPSANAGIATCVGAMLVEVILAGVVILVIKFFFFDDVAIRKFHKSTWGKIVLGIFGAILIGSAVTLISNPTSCDSYFESDDDKEEGSRR